MKKSVFITGGHDGTGFAIACRFALEGYNVFIGSRMQEKADAAAKKLQEKYGVFAKGYSYQTNTLDEDEVNCIFDDIKSHGYLLDTLVLNAANLGIGQVSLDVDINDFMSVFTTNIGWNFLMARCAAKQMKEKKKGAIVFIGSKSFAVDWGKYGIRSNCVLPGMIKTVRWENNENNCKYALANYTPIEDIATFEDVANAAWYLGSDQSKNTTGAEIVVDGGMLSQLTPNINRELW